MITEVIRLFKGGLGNGDGTFVRHRSRGDSGAGVKGEIALFRVSDDMFAGLNFTTQQLESERIGNQLLDRSLQRSRAKGRVVSLIEYRLPGGRRQLQRDLSIRQILAQPFELNVDDLRNLLFTQTIEDDDVINSVQKFRLEVFA